MTNVNETIKITVPAYEARPTSITAWQKLFTDAEQMEIFNRYCDIKDREAKYRRKSAAEMKALKAYAKMHDLKLVSGEEA